MSENAPSALISLPDSPTMTALRAMTEGMGASVVHSLLAHGKHADIDLWTTTNVIYITTSITILEYYYYYHYHLSL